MGKPANGQNFAWEVKKSDVAALQLGDSKWMNFRVLFIVSHGSSTLTDLLTVESVVCLKNYRFLFPDNLLGISWVDSSWIPILNNGSVLDYFSERSNPFYDRTCNNEVVKMQRMTLDHLNQMVGVEYILLHAQEPILFIIRKQQRQSPTQVIPLADYYIIAGVIYQAPDLGSVINSRVLTAVHGIQSAFEEAMSYCRYHPSKGYWWHFKDQEEREKAKPKAKKKEEPSSIFQRQRVDALLLDLRQKFPPKFVQQKPGEKPIPVDQIKKEPEPAPEAVKQEEKETVKNAQQSAGTKGPPEKRMRLQ
ncbi:PREDICTED: mediator of RNA polymerase II transcription subunit 6 [Chaetura pelagica]|uniref:mediator of RNA polymerase II transcription subunit 6 n=1 Tax=Chaetura pelagica TaxID=8897 RepID=UPI0005237F8D|nr:PREDICTED: mediator of RNA polymerase II transcription subunit 6 [Chaetura pelagica]